MPKKFYKVCEDCGRKYQRKSKLPKHKKICEARTCQGCWETGKKVIEPLPNGLRLCNTCALKHYHQTVEG